MKTPACTAVPPTSRPRALFICGSVNQTSMMHAIARALPEVEPSFTPYYVDGLLEPARRLGLLDMTIAGRPWRASCEAYLAKHSLPVDIAGARGGYDLVLTAQDAFMPKNIRRSRVVLVQEGMTDPENFAYRLVKRFRFLPRWISSTAAMGLSDLYDRFCVASPGYRDLFAKKGVREEKIVVTGIPNFDDCASYLRSEFPHRGYFLVCTSDGRETFKRDDRQAFLREAKRVAAGRTAIFKLHPNEKKARAIREIHAHFPGALIFTEGSAERMVAHCEALFVEYSTLAYVGLALGKEVHSYFPIDELRALLPLQHGRGAANIAEVCRELIGLPTRAAALEDAAIPALDALAPTNDALGRAQPAA